MKKHWTSAFPSADTLFMFTRGTSFARAANGERVK